MLLFFFVFSRWQRSYALVRDTVMISSRSYLLRAQPTYGLAAYPESVHVVNKLRNRLNDVPPAFRPGSRAGEP